MTAMKVLVRKCKQVSMYTNSYIYEKPMTANAMTAMKSISEKERKCERQKC